MKIGELATLTGVAVETIRYYEQQKLLPLAARSAANYRVYGPVQLERLRFIRQCRSLGLSLDEVRELLQAREQPAPTCAEVNHLIDRHLAHVRERLVELQALETQLRALRAQCAVDGAARCGILQGLEAAAVMAPSPAAVGVHGGPPRSDAC